MEIIKTTVDKLRIENCIVDVQNINITSVPKIITPCGSSLEGEGKKIIKEEKITEQKNYI